jgi:DNA-binding NtrC family response regulator
VALLDYKMPGMTGLELYREIKKGRPGTVAVIVSAYVDAATRDAALGAGAWRVLPKPVDLPRLLGLVDEALGQPLVLIVDDDAELCATLWDLLRERGYRVCLAGDARSAAERLKDRAYRVVLVDLRLPDADGAAVIHAVHAADSNARAVVITGHSELSPLVEDALREGADAVCHKPLDVPRLLEALERLTR